MSAALLFLLEPMLGNLCCRCSALREAHPQGRRQAEPLASNLVAPDADGIDVAGRPVAPKALCDDLGIRGPTELEAEDQDRVIELAVAALEQDDMKLIAHVAQETTAALIATTAAHDGHTLVIAGRRDAPIYQALGVTVTFVGDP